MKRIFPDVIEAYDRLDDFYSSDDIELEITYDEYVNRLPTVTAIIILPHNYITYC